MEKDKCAKQILDEINETKKILDEVKSNIKCKTQYLFGLEFAYNVLTEPVLVVSGATNFESTDEEDGD